LNRTDRLHTPNREEEKKGEEEARKPKIIRRMRKVKKDGIGTETRFCPGNENADRDFIIFVKTQCILYFYFIIIKKSFTYPNPPTKDANILVSM
jgi:hypothetical protein